MAKAPATRAPTVPAAVSAQAAALQFAIEVGAPPPTIERKVGQQSSPYAPVMKALPAPSGDKIAQFFVPVTVEGQFANEDEKAKAVKDEARKVSNRISGIARRLKSEDETMEFALRTKTENGVVGIRVYRIAATSSAPAPIGAPPQA